MPQAKVWNFNPVVLHERIWSPAGSARAVARAVGCHHQTILHRQEEYGIPKRPQSGTLLPGEWSHLYHRCQECGTTDRPHKGHGLCLNCYARLINYPKVRARRRQKRLADERQTDHR